MKFKIQTLLCLTAIAAVATQIAVLSWRTWGQEFTWILYGIHLCWTFALLTSLLASAVFIWRSPQPLAAGRTELTDERPALDPQHRQQWRALGGWTLLAAMMWLIFTVNSHAYGDEAGIAVISLHALPVAWIYHGRRWNSARRWPDFPLKTVCFANFAAFVLQAFAVGLVLLLRTWEREPTVTFPYGNPVRFAGSGRGL